MENNTGKDGMYTASLVLGLLATLMGGLILSILGLVFSVKSRKKLREKNETNGMVTAGFILSIIGLAKSTLIIILITLGIVVSLVAGNNGVLENSRKSNNSYYNSNYSHGYYNY